MQPPEHDGGGSQVALMDLGVSDSRVMSRGTVKLSLSGRWKCPQNGQKIGPRAGPFGTTWHKSAPYI